MKLEDKIKLMCLFFKTATPDLWKHLTAYEGDIPAGNHTIKLELSFTVTKVRRLEL